MSFAMPGKTLSTSANQRNAPGGILPPRTRGKSRSFIPNPCLALPSRVVLFVAETAKADVMVLFVFA
jgi:hypothetical protein